MVNKKSDFDKMLLGKIKVAIADKNNRVISEGDGSFSLLNNKKDKIIGLYPSNVVKTKYGLVVFDQDRVSNSYEYFEDLKTMMGPDSPLGQIQEAFIKRYNKQQDEKSGVGFKKYIRALFKQK